MIIHNPLLQRGTSRQFVDVYRLNSLHRSRYQIRIRDIVFIQHRNPSSAAITNAKFLYGQSVANQHATHQSNVDIKFFDERNLRTTGARLKQWWLDCAMRNGY
ncbi:hypothetical protein GCM10025859_00540 [Alicyclobacillus fastidiosus]|nr:hypothetical protein GCM10025859_00540 [Alicyclobacillus fastidiosus]